MTDERLGDWPHDDFLERLRAIAVEIAESR